MRAHLVGQQPIPGVTRLLRSGKTEGSERDWPVWASDHLGLVVEFERVQPECC